MQNVSLLASKMTKLWLFKNLIFLTSEVEVKVKAEVKIVVEVEVYFHAKFQDCSFKNARVMAI